MGQGCDCAKFQLPEVVGLPHAPSIAADEDNQVLDAAVSSRNLRQHREGSVKEREQAVQAYYSWASIRRLVEKREFASPPDLVLLRGTWLCEQTRPLPPRQGLEEASVWDETDLFDRSGCPVMTLVSVSHPWLTQEHPDPNGNMRQFLTSVITAAGENFAIFYDWCSLYQDKRSPLEEKAYQRCLDSMGLIYGHPEIHKWLLTALPASWAAKPLCDRGWPTFEIEMARMNMYDSTVLDLGQLSENEIKRRIFDYDRLRKVCSLPIKPPMSPLEFGREVRKKKFGVPSDQTVVVKAYHRAFDVVWCANTKLNYSALEWTDEDVTRLAYVLRDAAEALALQDLDLHRNAFGDVGVFELAAALPLCCKLERLSLGNSSIGDAGVKALAKQMSQCSLLRSLKLNHTEMTDNGLVALVVELKKMSTIEELDFSGALFGERGMKALTRAIPMWPALFSLRVSSLGVTVGDQVRIALEEAWAKASKERMGLIT